MSTMITFEPNKTSAWLTGKGWTASTEGIMAPEIHHLVDDANTAGIFGDVTVEMIDLPQSQAIVIVTVKSPAVVTRVASPVFSMDTLTAGTSTDAQAALNILTLVAEMAAGALAPMTTYVVSWTGGYEAPSFSQHATLAGANAQALRNAADQFTEATGDEIQVLEVVAGAPTVTLLSYAANGDFGPYLLPATADDACSS